jgi:hypothetical protein
LGIKDTEGGCQAFVLGLLAFALRLLLFGFLVLEGKRIAKGRRLLKGNC